MYLFMNTNAYKYNCVIHMIMGGTIQFLIHSWGGSVFGTQIDSYMVTVTSFSFHFFWIN